MENSKSAIREMSESEFSELTEYIEKSTAAELFELESSTKRLDNGDVLINFNPSRREFLRSSLAGLVVGTVWMLTPQKAQAIFNVLMMRKRASSSSVTYVDDVFSAYTYTGTSGAQTINNGMALTTVATGGTSVGQQAYTTPGTFSWTCPNGVSSVSVVCVGGGGQGQNSASVGVSGGGGGGGGLGWKNNIPVVPGVSYSVIVGASGNGGNGGDSSFISVTTVRGGGGTIGTNGIGGTYTGDGGGNGGYAGSYGGAYGGGGAGGYSGAGGNGGTELAAGGAGSGGGGGGGGAANPSQTANATGAGQGGGVGLLGQGTSGAGGLTGTAGAGGAGGSGGANGNVGYGGANYAAYGGGGGSGNGSAMPGAGGAVRIIWGTGRSFPSTLTTDQTVVNNNDATVTVGAGLVWIKNRTLAVAHLLFDTTRSGQNWLQSNSNLAATTDAGFHISSFNANGFSLQNAGSGSNQSGQKYISWTFRKAAKFFDCGTYTGNLTPRAIAHSLGVAPGMIIVKRTDNTSDWSVWHRSYSQAFHYLWLNSSNPVANSSGAWNLAAATSTEFSIGNDPMVNTSGASYIWYAFAHDSGVSGLIQCGSFTSTVAALNVNLGWEPQFLLYKRASGTDGWHMADSTRGWNVDRSAATVDIEAQATSVEAGYGITGPTATGFTHTNGTAGDIYVYMAVRRPNKPPTAGTQVYNALARAGNNSITAVTGLGFTPDLLIGAMRNDKVNAPYTEFFDRLRGPTQRLAVTLNAGEAVVVTPPLTSFDMDGFTVSTDTNGSGAFNYTGNHVTWAFKRAVGVFDVTYFQSTMNTNQRIPHSLNAAPEFALFKSRNGSNSWYVWCNQFAVNKYMLLDNAAIRDVGAVVCTTPSATDIGFITSAFSTGASETWVSYLFATKAGISKVGSYTGDGTSGRVINCGFTTGARFIWLRRTDTIGDWYVWDSARGIVAGNDPQLSINTQVAEVTSYDSIDANSTGFIVNQVAATDINVSAANYIFLALA